MLRKAFVANNCDAYTLLDTSLKAIHNYAQDVGDVRYTLLDTSLKAIHNCRLDVALVEDTLLDTSLKAIHNSTLSRMPINSLY